MNLPYPGGPYLDKLATEAEDLQCSRIVDSTAIVNGYYRFPVAKVADYDFSFSGLKTSVLRLKEKLSDEIWEKDKAKIASAFQKSIAETFYQKIKLASDQTELKRIVLAGGVAANSEIRKVFQDKFNADAGYELLLPGLEYCTDNAAMIASAGYFKLVEAKQDFSNLDFEVYSRR